jgi:hypothetical protein
VGGSAPVTPEGSPGTFQDTRSALAASATPAAAVSEAAPGVQADAPEPLRIGPSPWFWLALALLSGVLALAAHRRLRAR